MSDPHEVGGQPSISAEERIKAAALGAAETNQSVEGSIEEEMSDSARTSKHLGELRTDLLTSKNPLKKTVGYFLFVGVPAAAVVLGAIELFGEAADKSTILKSIQEFISHPEKSQGITPEEATDRHLGNLKIDYARFGMSENLHIQPLTDSNHGKDESVIYLAANSGGPGWIFAFAVNNEGQPIEGKPSDVALNDLVKQLNLSESEQVDLRAHWVEFNNQGKDPNNSEKALNWLRNHRVNPAVTSFYQYAIDVYKNDSDKETIQDRIEALEKWQSPQAKTESAVKVEARVHDGFFDVASYAIGKAGGNVEESLGGLETAAVNLPVDIDLTHTTALALDVTELSGPRNQLLEGSFNPLPLILSGLLLLRMGPRLPKKIVTDINKGIEDVYYWFRLGQPERMMRDLVVLGQRLLPQKRTDKGNLP